MNGKDYIRNTGYFINRIAESSGLSCSTVNDLANVRVMVENCRAALLQ